MKVSSVKYLNGYKLLILFEDGISKTVDFEQFLMNSLQPMTNQFMEIELFKQVRIQMGNLTWLDNEMDISGEYLYNMENNGNVG
jgi:hypothetical protein